MKEMVPREINCWDNLTSVNGARKVHRRLVVQVDLTLDEMHHRNTSRNETAVPPRGGGYACTKQGVPP